MLVAPAQPFPMENIGCWACWLWDGFDVLVHAKEPSMSHPAGLPRMVEPQEDLSPSLVFNWTEATPDINLEVAAPALAPVGTGTNDSTRAPNKTKRNSFMALKFLHF